MEANLVRHENHMSLLTKIAGLAGNAATTEADLEAATAIRMRDHADFEKSEMVLLEVVGTLGDRHLRQEGASMPQL